MKGWRTRSFATKLFVHHRPMGSHGQRPLKARFRQGEQDYFTGGHPVWQLFRSAFQMSRRPYVVGGICLLLGYASSFLRRAERPIPRELVEFHQAEQIARLRRHLFGRSRCARTGHVPHKAGARSRARQTARRRTAVGRWLSVLHARRSSNRHSSLNQRTLAVGPSNSGQTNHTEWKDRV
jgi:hypothetical protein